MIRSRKQLLWGFLIWICSYAISAAQSGRGETSGISLFDKEVSLPVVSGQRIYSLPDSLIVPDSQILHLDSLLLRPEFYKLDFISGTVTFTRAVDGFKTIHATYQVFPFAIRRRYAHRQPVRETVLDGKDGLGVAPAAKRIVKPGPAAQDFFPSRLHKSGSIIRGLSVGTNQNLQVDSGLRLQLSGKLTQDVEVVASLTDQNTPIQPEGNTQTLQELDKVFIQLKGPRLQATLGDFNLTFNQQEFTRYNRKLQGFLGEGSYPNVKFKVSGAVSRGQFNTNEFLGQEGNQGPYQLTGPNGEINILVLAGTERVWIDGEEMTRGENNDYVIEYGNGQITFTRKRLITADSRIVVDFQFSAESFQRNYWAAQVESQVLNDKVKFGTTVIRESDNKNDPLSLNLTDEFLDRLQQAGDGEAVVPGWKFVGPDSGNYVMEDSGVFRFVGTKKGEYVVSFSFFGQNKGDYRNIGLGRFEYVGENLGSYRPFVILPKATRHDMFGFNLTAQPVSAFQINSEVAVSQFDRNTYSPVDDGDNRGGALAVQFAFNPQRLAFGKLNLGQFRLTGKIRRKDRNFRDIDRTTIAEFNRKWDLENRNLSEEESIQELRAQYIPVHGLQFSSGFGHLSKASSFTSNRWDAQTSLSRKHLPKLNYFVEFIDRNDRSAVAKSSWLRQRGHSEFGFWFLKPSFDYEGEIKKEAVADSGDSGFRFDSYTGGLELRPWKRLFLTSRYNVRDDKSRRAGIFLPKSIARTQTYSVGLSKWHAFNVSAAYTHRTRSFPDSLSQDTRTDLADVKLGFRPQSGSVRGNVYYQISNTQIASQEEVFVEVEEGQGNFRFNEELNEFEPDPFGNFVKRVFATKNFIPVVELRFRTDVWLSARRFFGKQRQRSQRRPLWKKILWPLSTQTLFRIDERTREKDVSKIYLLDLSRFQQDSTTVFGSMELRQDVYLWENSRKLSLRYRFRSRSELNNQLVDGGQDRDVREHGLRLLQQISDRVTTRWELKHRSEDRIFDSPTREDRRVRSDEISLDLVYRPRSRVEVGLKSEFSRNTDLVPAPHTRANLYSLAPRTNYSLSNKGRLRAELQWTYVSTSPKTVLIPFELTGGNRAGTTLRWNLGLDYRLSQNVQMSFNYFGRSEPNRPQTQHIAKVEMRAFF